MIYTLKNESIKVTVNSKGAEMISVVKDGKERLWQNDDGSWDGHALTLFPFCSTVSVWINKKLYPNTIHGFASSCEFSLVSQTTDGLTLRLCQSEETKKHYPYDFTLDISFAVEKNGVKITHRIFNPMDIPLPYACGCHESYAIDAPIDDYVLKFDKDEQFKNRSSVYRNTEKGYGDMGTGKVLALRNEYFKNDASLAFLDMNSRSVSLCKKDGTEIANVSYDGSFTDLVFWKTESGAYICMEPWMNFCDMTKDDRTEFSKKRGIFSLAPGCERTHTHTVTYR